MNPILHRSNGNTYLHAIDPMVTNNMYPIMLSMHPGYLYPGVCLFSFYLLQIKEWIAKYRHIGGMKLNACDGPAEPATACTHQPPLALSCSHHTFPTDIHLIQSPVLRIHTIYIIIYSYETSLLIVPLTNSALGWTCQWYERPLTMWLRLSARMGGEKASPYHYWTQFEQRESMEMYTMKRHSLRCGHS